MAPATRRRGGGTGSIGPGAPIDTDRYFVVCPNVLGGCQGTTGPASLDADGRPLGSRFPVITIRDQVAVEMALADQLGIARWAGVVGGSMGGMRVLEWCVGAPERVARAVVLLVGAAASADQIALCSLQIRAIRSDPAFHGGDYYETPDRPVDGLSIARGIGHFSYRTGAEFEQRFGRRPQGEEEPLKGGRYAVESYLQHHGEKLAQAVRPELLHHPERSDEPPRRRPGPGWPGGSARRGAGRRHRGRHHDGPALPAGAPGGDRPPSSRPPPVAVVESVLRARRVPARDRAGGSHRPVRAGGAVPADGVPVSPAA